MRLQKKKQQPQSKPSYTSQAKADSLPEANNIVKVQSTLPLTPIFFRLTKSYNCPDDLCGKISVIDKIPIPS